MGNNKLLIAIPSKNRIATLLKYTYSWVKYTQAGELKIFVEPQDYDEYVQYIPADNLIVIPENNKGLGYVKEQILFYAKQTGSEYIFKLDDDIRCFMDFRHSFKDSKEKITFFDRMVKELVSVLEDNDKLKCICFPYSFELYEKKKWEKTKRVATAYLIKTFSMHADRRISVFEDFAAGLHIWANNGSVLKYGLTGIDLGVDVGKGTGGHQSYDRKPQAYKEIDALREIYPPLKFKKVTGKSWDIEPDLRSVKL